MLRRGHLEPCKVARPYSRSTPQGVSNLPKHRRPTTTPVRPIKFTGHLHCCPGYFPRMICRPSTLSKLPHACILTWSGTALLLTPLAELETPAPPCAACKILRLPARCQDYGQTNTTYQQKHRHRSTSERAAGHPEMMMPSPCGAQTPRTVRSDTAR